MGNEEEEAGPSKVHSIALREFVRKAVRDNLPDEYRDKVPLLKELMQVVRDAIAAELQVNVNLILDNYPKETAPQARRLVDLLENDFAALGLAFKDPRTGAPSRLTLAATPPQNEDQSWLQLEPLPGTKATPPNRLERPLPLLPIISAPSPSRTANQSPRRGG
ncbi:MAG TPA: hypothetical protein VGN12_19420 [Pirellulales bacterium]|jgi:hypothetical protein